MNDCPSSVFGLHDTGRDGRCVWCRRRIGAPAQIPDRFDDPSDLTLAYDYYYGVDDSADQSGSGVFG